MKKTKAQDQEYVPSHKLTNKINNKRHISGVTLCGFRFCVVPLPSYWFCVFNVLQHLVPLLPIGTMA